MNRRSMLGSSVETWLFGDAPRRSLVLHNVCGCPWPFAVLWGKVDFSILKKEMQENIFVG